MYFECALWQSVLKHWIYYTLQTIAFCSNYRNSVFLNFLILSSILGIYHTFCTPQQGLKKRSKRYNFTHKSSIFLPFLYLSIVLSPPKTVSSAETNLSPFANIVIPQFISWFYRGNHFFTELSNTCIKHKLSNLQLLSKQNKINFIPSLKSLLSKFCLIIFVFFHRSALFSVSWDLSFPPFFLSQFDFKFW